VHDRGAKKSTESIEFSKVWLGYEMNSWSGGIWHAGSGVSGLRWERRATWSYEEGMVVITLYRLRLVGR
jgi:hypothetical protein